MPRSARAALGGFCYHVLNRGNGRAEVCHDPDDFHAFVRLLRQAQARLPMRLLAFCLMPNHFHLVLWPLRDGDLGDWMGWLLTTQVARYRKRYGGSGHLWQGRFKAFPIQEDHHLLAVLRYVERNPLRANLVERAELWQWSSLRWWRQPPQLPFLDPGPVPRPADWLELVHQPQTDAELARLRHSVRKGTPFGGEDWVKSTCAALGLEHTLRSRGRPQRQPSEEGGMGPLFA